MPNIAELIKDHVATAEPAPTVPALGGLADMAALIADSRRALDEYNRGDEAVIAAYLPLREALTDEQWALFSAHDTAQFMWQMQAEELLLAELCRHLPGLSTTIRAIYDHLQRDGAETGVCCLPEPDHA